MSEFVKFQVSDDLRNLQDDIIKKISKSGKIKIGINEVTKAIVIGTAKLVAIAEDVTPAEIVMHIPIIAKEKNIPITYFKTKDDLGKAVGISAKASSIAIMDAGVLSKELASLVSKINEVNGSGPKEAPKKAEAKPKEDKPKDAEAKPKADKPKDAEAKPKADKPKEAKPEEAENKE
jgi:large subunit ribosomal protein L7Ae